MKKLLTTASVIAACAALCAAVWPRNEAGGKVPADAKNGDLSACMDVRSQPTVAEIIPLSDDTLVILTTEYAAPEPVEETAEKEESPDEPLPDKSASPAAKETPAAPIEPVPTQEVQSVASASSNPYHTDVYPNNVYSEELIYDADSNLVGKTVTYPTAFDSDTIWIDGRAYYDLPGFGLIEWSGPGQRTEDYTMYESGVKVGIMGCEHEAPTSNAPIASPELTEPTGEVIDQTINTRPKKSSTPPDNKPNTAPTDVGCKTAQFIPSAVHSDANDGSAANIGRHPLRHLRSCQYRLP